jgi:hypothetical protein
VVEAAAGDALGVELLAGFDEGALTELAEVVVVGGGEAGDGGVAVVLPFSELKCAGTNEVRSK